MLKDKLLQDLKEAMKNKNTNKKNAVQMVRAAILQVEKDNGIELNDEEILPIIVKEIKSRKDSIEELKIAQREDLIEKNNEEIEILEGYLPKQLSDDELEKVLKEIILNVQATTMKDMGKVMKEAKNRIGVQADGKRINEKVKELLM